MVAVKFPRSTGKTGVRLKSGVEDKDALHLGSAKMERGRHSPSSPSCQGGKTEKVEGDGGRRVGTVWTIETFTKGRGGGRIR